MKKMTAEWVRKAEADEGMAKTLAAAKTPFYDGICYHCQQAAEKFLKSLLQELSLEVPRTHELTDLMGLLLPHHPALHSHRRGFDFLTRFAVNPRYPGFRASKTQARSAMRWEKRVGDACRDLLGIPLPEKHKRN
jgi:HEPN domain-containing protein